MEARIMGKELLPRDNEAFIEPADKDWAIEALKDFAESLLVFQHSPIVSSTTTTAEKSQSVLQTSLFRVPCRLFLAR